MTEAEIILWSQLKKRQLGGIKFRRQYSVDTYVVDFYTAKPRLAIEIDGPTHFKEGAKEYDKERQRHIESCGISFLRFTNKDIYKNLSRVLQTISHTVNQLLK